MAEIRQTIAVSVDANELVPTMTWETKRKEVTAEGALGVANHTGLVGLALNGTTAVRLWLHEDKDGYVVIDVLDGRDNTWLARVDAELRGLVPPRLGAKVKRERRFGDEPLGS